MLLIKYDNYKHILTQICSQIAYKLQLNELAVYMQGMFSHPVKVVQSVIANLGYHTSSNWSVVICKSLNLEKTEKNLSYSSEFSERGEDAGEKFYSN